MAILNAQVLNGLLSLPGELRNMNYDMRISHDVPFSLQSMPYSSPDWRNEGSASLTFAQTCCQYCVKFRLTYTRNNFPKVPDQLVGQYLLAFVFAIGCDSGISSMSSVSLHYYRSDIYGLEILLLLKRAATGPPSRFEIFDTPTILSKDNHDFHQILVVRAEDNSLSSNSRLWHDDMQRGLSGVIIRPTRPSTARRNTPM